MTRGTSGGGLFPRRLLTLIAVAGLVVAAIAMTPARPAFAWWPHMTGRAYGIAASGLVNIAPTPDTGPVGTSSATTVAPPCVVSISGAVSAHSLCARVVTSVNPGTSTATASIQDATIRMLGLPVITLGLIQSGSRTTCAGSAGRTSIASLAVGHHVIDLSVAPGPNTVVSVLGVTLVLNEQRPVPNADHGLTVNAVHLIVPGLFDVVLASATSDIHNC